MLTIVFRSVIIYLLVLILYRIMGKRQLGQMQPFELVLTLIIADLATIPMAEVSVPVLHGVVPVLTLVILHFVLSVLSQVSNRFAHFLSGKPVIVINSDGLDYKALKSLNLSVADVFEAIRGCGYFSIEQVQYAIMETNGKMSVLPKSEFSPVTIGDMKLDVEENSLPINIINEGKILKENLKIANIDENQISEILKQGQAKKVSEVLILTIDRNGAVFFQKFGEKCKSFNISPLSQVEQ